MQVEDIRSPGTSLFDGLGLGGSIVATDEDWYGALVECGLSRATTTVGENSASHALGLVAEGVIDRCPLRPSPGKGGHNGEDAHLCRLRNGRQNVAHMRESSIAAYFDRSPKERTQTITAMKYVAMNRRSAP